MRPTFQILYWLYSTTIILQEEVTETAVTSCAVTLRKEMRWLKRVAGTAYSAMFLFYNKCNPKYWIVELTKSVWKKSK